MLILPALTVELIHSATVSSVRLISTTEQYLILLSHLFNVILEEGALYIVNTSVGRCGGHLDERFLLSLNILSGLEVIYPS